MTYFTRKAGCWLLLLAVLAACCPATKIENSWREPDTVINTAALNKFVVMALLKNESVRRRAEDQLAAAYPGKAIQSYQVFGTTELKDNEANYRQKLQAGGYDGIVIMRLVKVEKDQRYVRGNYPAYYGSWWGYYRYAWPVYYDPGYYTTDKTYYVEVNVYSTRQNKLVWSGITSTINPSGSDALFTDVIKAVSKQMRKEGFVQG